MRPREGRKWLRVHWKVPGLMLKHRSAVTLAGGEAIISSPPGIWGRAGNNSGAECFYFESV